MRKKEKRKKVALTLLIAVLNKLTARLCASDLVALTIATIAPLIGRNEEREREREMK